MMNDTTPTTRVTKTFPLHVLRPSRILSLRSIVYQPAELERPMSILVVGKSDERRNLSYDMRSVRLLSSYLARQLLVPARSEVVCGHWDSAAYHRVVMSSHPGDTTVQLLLGCSQGCRGVLNLNTSQTNLSRSIASFPQLVLLHSELKDADNSRRCSGPLWYAYSRPREVEHIGWSTTFKVLFRRGNPSACCESTVGFFGKRSTAVAVSGPSVSVVVYETLPSRLGTFSLALTPPSHGSYRL
ncbi:uncharacterized protein B0H18DRAFT_341329 [Fomitopsis serialis]|uniref:uncharacterized protein n=1 Tax=Fomitopsis serialis TaxID=139415 RepID=UPI002008A6AB|nr:uncharacterized protein B0H18DRAFT_341329 [Neoantrodia serialis]KAH9926419.1 hypothetical protein B0H18DRAFT_341329 [Neoantrodia serialis]